MYARSLVNNHEYTMMRTDLTEYRRELPTSIVA